MLYLSLKMWKIFSLVLLATAAASPTLTRDDQLQSPLETKVPTLNKFEKMKNILQKDCNIYGPKDAFNNLEESFTKMIKEFFSTLSSEIKKDLANNQVSDYLSIACRSILEPSFKEQLEKVTTNLKQCAEPRLKAYIHSNFEFLEFACSNDGKLLTSFIKEGGIQCIKKHQRQIKKCVQEVFSTQFENVKDPETLFDDPRKVCKSLTIIKKCATQELQHCSSPSAVKLVDGFLNLNNFPICTEA